MPVNRIINQTNLKKSDSVLLVYGQVNDTFITKDLTLYNVDGIERILCRYLRENGYEQIIFYAPERQLYCYDEQSYHYCFPGQTTQAGNSTTAAQAPPADGRPLGEKRFFRRTASSTPSAAMVQWNRREGFIPIVHGGSDTAVLDIIREAFFQRRRKSAVIFSQYDNPSAGSEIQRILLALIPRIQRRRMDNKCIIITNAVDEKTLKEVFDNIPSLSKIITMDGAGKGLDSLVYIGYPQKDELRSLIHRERLLKEKELDWLHVERIVAGLDQERDELKRWEKELQDIPRIDIPSINPALTNPLSEEEQPAFRQLDALVGLTELKKALRRYVYQMRDQLENNPYQKPLMHIVLKGNPGTGKSKLARLIAAILREEGLLERGHLVEGGREKLVAGYVGQTAIKTDACCRDALGGVLFIDEAYALAPRDAQHSTGSSQDFGQEAIDTLIKRMTDWQGRFCVILAGYPDDMDRLLEANRGFASRISQTIHIEDYQPQELAAIFGLMAQGSRRVLPAAFEEAILHVFTHLYKQRGKNFSNARTVEQVFGKIDGHYLDRCLQQKLDRRQEPYSVEDIPKELAAYTEQPSAEGSAMERLHAMTGLKKAKEQIRKQLALVRAGQQSPEYAKGRRLHMIFKGNPGTGKTTVARLVGEIYKHYDILPSNNFVEASRADLVGAVVGETAQKVTRKCKEALGGILFIDEVYTLINGQHDPFGQEAVDTLVKIMEDERDKLCVIIAGYPAKVRDFLDANQGLQRRFSAEIGFEDYDHEQLFHIFQRTAGKKGISMEEDVPELVYRILKAVYERRDEKFGNAGEVENIIQQIQENHALYCDEQHLPITTPVSRSHLPLSILHLLPVDNSDEMIEAALKELNGLIGLSSVKSHIDRLVKEYKHERRREMAKRGLVQPKRSYHMIFKGNPGTGKTTVARILGKIFKALDILKKGEVVEVTRMHLVAGYSGQTAIKAEKEIRNAFDSILFIDEAYSLSSGMMDSFGEEAINVLNKMMEDHRDRLVVIAAGYPREMRNFQRTNTGLASRFNEITFPDYDVKEMAAIFKLEISKLEYILSEELPEEQLEKQLNFYRSKRGADFGNARDIQNFLNNIVLPRYRDRVEQLDPADKAYWTITVADFPNLEEQEQADDAGTSKATSGTTFSPAQEKNDQRNATSALNHSGSGDNVSGNKFVINYYENVEKELPAALTAIPAVEGRQIFGRDDIVLDIFSKLFDQQGPRKVLIYGVAGMGKSATLIKFIQTHQAAFKHIVWLNVNETLQKTFVENNQLLEHLKISFTEKEDGATRYARVIARLQQTPETSLLVLDDLPASAADEFQQLSLPGFRIIASARQSIPGGYPILLEPLTPAAASSLFLSIYNEQEHTNRLDELLEPVSYHPLAVEVLARILKTNPAMQFDRLLELVGHDLQTLVHQIPGGAGEGVLRIFNTLFKAAHLTEAEMEFLHYFSVLPARPAPRKILYELFELDSDEKRDRFSDVVLTLSRKGFITEDADRGLFCHQIIQQVCRSEAMPTVENCLPLFKTLGTELGNKIDTAMAGSGLYTLITDYLHILETFITHFEEEELSFYRVYINLSLLYRISGQFDRSIQISLREKEVLEPRKQQFPVWYNIITRNLGYTSAYKGAYTAAVQYYTEGVCLLEQIDPEGHDNREGIECELILSYSQLGILQLTVEKHDIAKAIEYFEKGITIVDNSSYDNPIGIAALKEGLALAQIEDGECAAAIENLKEAKELLIKGLAVDQNALLIGMLDLPLALAYAGEKDYRKAAQYAGWAIEIIRKHLPEDNMEFCRAYNVAGIIELQDALQQLDANGIPEPELFEKAGDLLLKAISILEKHRGAGHEDLAMMYSNYGLALRCSGNEEAGYRQHMKGMDIYKRMDHKNDLMAGMLFRTFIFFEEELSAADAEDYLLLCLKIIPDTHDNLVTTSFVNYCLGHYRHKRGQSRDGIDAVHTALKGVRTYYGKSSDPENDSPLEVICLQALADMHSAIGEHYSAIKWQQETVQLCEAHMQPTNEELTEPYIGLALVYLAAAKELGDKKMYADSLEYKIRAEKLNKKAVQQNKELDESGELYLVTTNNEKGAVKKHLVIIPSDNFSGFENDLRNNALRELHEYGYEVPAVSETFQNPDAMSLYTDKYGPLKDLSGRQD